MKKILIYWKWRVWNAVAKLCDFKNLDYEILDDSDLKKLRESWKDKELNFKKYDYIIPSPWINPEHFIYKEYSDKIIWELDFAYKYLCDIKDKNNLNIKIIWITWTDWKSTTSHVLYKLLEKKFWKEKVYLWGNFDSPLSEIVLDLETHPQSFLLKNEGSNIHIILEISSFMAHNIKDISFDYSIFTNFNPDHLNWHKDLKEYFNDKFKVIKHTKYKSIINNKISYVYDIFNEIDKAWITKDKIKMFLEYWNTNSEINKIEITKELTYLVTNSYKYNFNNYILKWNHNAENLLSVILVAEGLWLDTKFIDNTLKDIPWLEHRIELILEKDWIKYVEDSKCTTSQSLLASLSSFEWNIILIVWWDNKWEDFSNVIKDIKSKVKYLVILWTDMKDLFTDIAKKSWVNYWYAENMNIAVDLSNSKAKSWDIILLSPWCSSFDIFKNWLDRAEQFRNSVLLK